MARIDGRQNGGCYTPAGRLREQYPPKLAAGEYKHFLHFSACAPAGKRNAAGTRVGSSSLRLQAKEPSLLSGNDHAIRARILPRSAGHVLPADPLARELLQVRKVRSNQIRLHDQ